MKQFRLAFLSLTILVSCIASTILNGEGAMLGKAYGQTPNDCVLGDIIENNTCDGSGSFCSVQVGSSIYTAYFTDGGTQCTNPRRLSE